MKVKENYGNILTEKRIELGLTVKKISQITGIPERKILKIELEKAAEFSLHDLTKYAEGLNIPLNEILQRNGVLFECKKIGGNL